MSVTDIGGEKRIFLRKASGLIRTASLTDTFIYNLGVVSIGLGVGSLLYYGPAFYPQGDLIWGSIIAGVAMAMISFGFITWTITLPRSGGIYVFGSRILPPAIALTMSLVEITAWLFYCAIAAYWIVILALAPMFAGLNLLTGNETFLTISKTMLEPWATFVIGAAILILSQVVLSYGMRFYLTTNKWVFVLAMASTVFLIVVLAMGSREQFMTNLNELVGPSLGVPDAYNAIIASGKEKGWGEAGFDFWQTLLVSNWPVETVSAKLLTTDIFRRQAADAKLARAEALRQSMRHVMQNESAKDGGGKPAYTYAHPAFWAAFSLVGDGQ